MAPIQIKQRNHPTNRWFDDEIKLRIKNRDFAYKKARLHGSDENWKKFKEEKNLVTKTIQRKKKEYYENLIDQNKNNSKEMWKGIKEVMNGKSKNTIH